jgi:membrane-associated phospholipid phosphatase
MHSFDDVFTWAVLGLIVAVVVGFYAWMFWRETRGFFAAMIRLRNRIDRSRRW